MDDLDWKFEHTYAALPGMFHTACLPQPVSQPKWILFNQTLADSMGLGAPDLLQPPLTFSGNALPSGSRPLAMAYAGHQFGHFTMLGDGRAHLLGEHRTPEGRLLDVQLKGSGITRFSRQGDGRAALGPMLREYIISEAMHALGIPTTRSLAVITTGDAVRRERPMPGAILTRIAASHLRIGTFQYAAEAGGQTAVKTLADYTLQRHYPGLLEHEDPYLSLLETVIDRQAELIARWMQAGFIHGVMNTDNMTLSGETIDYGPCAFMNQFNDATVFSSIDHAGRYAYGNQPQIAWWNLARLAETLAPLTSAQGKRTGFEMTEACLHTFPERYQSLWLKGMRGKLGLLNEEKDDGRLIQDFLALLQERQWDYTQSFRSLSDLLPFREGGSPEDAWQPWLQRWHQRLTRQPIKEHAIIDCMHRHNPVVIPRNHLVEQALAAAVDEHHLQPLEALLKILAHPYKDDHYPEPYLSVPPPNPAYRTFCGT